MKYSHAFDLAFEVETDKEVEQVTEKELVAALMKRLHTLLLEPEGNILDAMSCYDTMEVDDE